MLIKKLFNLMSREDGVFVDMELLSVMNVAQVLIDNSDESVVTDKLVYGAIGTRIISTYRKIFIGLLKESGMEINYFKAKSISKEVATMAIENKLKLAEDGMYDYTIGVISDLILTCMFSDVLPIVKKEESVIDKDFKSIVESKYAPGINCVALHLMYKDYKKYCKCNKGDK